MSTPKIYEIREALDTVLYDALEPAYNAGKVQILPPAEEHKPDPKKIWAINTLSPGEVFGGEIPLRIGAGRRPGVYTVLLSSPFDVNSNREAMNLADTVSKAFWGRTIPAGEGKKVNIDMVDITNTGTLPDNRLGHTVTVNWWARAGEYEGD